MIQSTTKNKSASLFFSWPLSLFVWIAEKLSLGVSKRGGGGQQFVTCFGWPNSEEATNWVRVLAKAPVVVVLLFLWWWWWRWWWSCCGGGGGGGGGGGLLVLVVVVFQDNIIFCFNAPPLPPPPRAVCHGGPFLIPLASVPS